MVNLAQIGYCSERQLQQLLHIVVVRAGACAARLAARPAALRTGLWGVGARRAWGHAGGAVADVRALLPTLLPRAGPLCPGAGKSHSRGCPDAAQARTKMTKDAADASVAGKQADDGDRPPPPFYPNDLLSTLSAAAVLGLKPRNPRAEAQQQLGLTRTTLGLMLDWVAPKLRALEHADVANCAPRRCPLARWPARGLPCSRPAQRPPVHAPVSWRCSRR
jgi:hypothetical protein